MKNLHSNFKISLTLLFLLALSFSFFAFNDYGQYKIKGNVIIRGPESIYQVGKINIKFRDFVSGFGKTAFSVAEIDAVLSNIEATNIRQMHPLKQDVSKRKIGDEDLSKIFEITYSKSMDPFDAAEMILNSSRNIIDWAEPSFVYVPDFIPNDPQISAQWHINTINSYQAWDITRGDTSIIVGIVDSGSDFDHPDLAANFKINWNEPINSIDDDNNGYVDDWRGWDFWGNDNNAQILPTSNDHGAHVSGCASQVTDNNVHGGGIGFKTKLLVTKHTDDSNPLSGLYYTDNGIIYMYQNGAKVINCSFGSSFFSSYSQTVVTNAFLNGSVICASAGNGDANGIGQNWARYPASYDNVVSVAATTSGDIKTVFSNFHSTVDVSAPGQNILSTVFDNSYAAWDGTSMSSPITAGTVALIRASHPAWTPTEVVNRLLIGVDSIYNLNPSYVGLLGTGRVNAFKCVADKPIFRITSSAHNDSLFGNNDKVYDVNEVIAIGVSLKNTHLAGNNVSLRMTTASPYVTLVQDSVFLGNVGAYSTIPMNMTNIFKVKANTNCPFDTDVQLKVSASGSAYTDNAANTITIKFRQGFAVHNINNLKLCLTKDGNVGKKAQSYGSGLMLGTGTVNNIYEGGLMIGMNNTKVSDVVRRSQTPANASDTDFYALKSYTLTAPGTFSGQDGNGKFNDDGAGSNKIGVEVEAFSYAYNTTPDMNYIILKYRIKNTNAAALSNVYAGLFTWFAPDGFFNSNNITRLNQTNRLAYTYNTSVSNNYLGIGLMTNQQINFKPYTSSEILNGFTTQEKWDGLSMGIVSDSIGPGGNAFTLAVGPLNLAPNQVETIGFAVINAPNVAELITRNNAAKQKYASVGIKTISSEIPREFSLGQNYPNPFNPVTNIQFGLPKNSFVTIKIFDILGREVSVLINEFKEAGMYEINFNASKLSSGMYFYRIEAGSFSGIKRMVLLK
ncbi:MAG: S8 family serine peptidase [Ignavibacteria bacterium]|nr:S8 family serine peptidase [Ignavibacteria bacterium]